jgi:hypothetical protein
MANATQHNSRPKGGSKLLDYTNSRGVPPRVRYEMARARYQLNETAGRERLGRGASQQRSRPTRARDCGRATKYIYILLQRQAEWQSRHEGIDIAGELLEHLSAGQQQSRPTRAQDVRRDNNCFESKPSGSRATRALDIAGELLFCYFI